MRPITLLAALATAASAQLNFTEPPLDKPIPFGGDSINIQWTIPPGSKYSAFNTSAALFFKGPRDVDYRITPTLFTGLGVTGQRWDLEEFKKEMFNKSQTFTQGRDYYFEIRFTNMEGAVEKSEKYTIEGMPMSSGAAKAVQAGCMAIAAVAGAAVAMVL